MKVQTAINIDHSERSDLICTLIIYFSIPKNFCSRGYSTTLTYNNSTLGSFDGVC